MTNCPSIESITFQALVIFTALLCVSVSYFGFIISWCKQGTSSNKTSASKVIKNTRGIRIASCIALTLYLTSCIQFSIFSALDLANGGCDSGGTANGFETNLLAFYVLLVVFSLRILKTFENTVYAFSENHIKCIKIWLIIPVVIFCAALSFRLAGILTIEIASAFSTVFVIIVVGICIGLLKLFIAKLTQVINDFLKEFGALSPAQLRQLNKSLRYAVREL